MELIDTHSHIYLEEFNEDREKMIQCAERESVAKILLPAISAETHEAMLAIEANFPDTCLAMMGLHPCSVKENYLEELKIVRQYLEKRKFIAVGEIGLDFYWDKTFTKQQYAAFHEQIEWAKQYEIPIVIHSRSSTDECIEVVKEHQNGKLKGVFHCFSGNAEQAKKIIELDFYLGIGGVLTFKNSELDKAIEDIDLSRLLLETDAPYLAPVPFRGKRNEPSYLKYVVQKLAEVKSVSIDEVADVTTVNAVRLFNC